MNGTWGEASFADTLRQSACATSRDGVKLVVMKNAAQKKIVVWPLWGGGPTKDSAAIVEVMYDAASASRAETIVGSIGPK
jgi:hypothetical protein